jgi:gliding motility-associated-like protein
VVDIASIASFNTIRNCRINAPVTTSATTNIVGIFSSTLRGNGNNKIVSNIITGGASGIYMTALNATNKSLNNIIDSNTVNSSYFYNIYLQNMDFVKVRQNAANITNPRNATSYGIYIFDCDSAIAVSNNTVNINTVTGTFYGMYFNSNASINTTPGQISNNTVLAASGNTGTGYGIYQTGSLASKFINNVVSLNTSSATAYGLYHTTGSVEYTNNTINNYATATTATTSYAAYLNQTTGAQTLVRNNIFAHNNNGRAIYMPNANFIYSDYNMLYTNGTVLGTFNLGAIPNLKKWIDTTGWDFHSIQFKPSFVSNTNLQPDLANPEVWGIHGRGVQIAGNDKDFNGNARPVTLAAGVPDLGAYEFVPTSIPVLLVATPAIPASNTIQKFSLGTDTVSVIKWGAAVPATITGKRYTGTIPPGLAPAQQFMYFYTDFDVPAGTYNYEMQQNYMDPWRGTIPNEPIIKMGRTNAANAWIVSTTSTISVLDNFIKEPNLSFIDKYTGLTDGLAAPPPIDPIVLDTASFGTRFWVGYGHHQFFPGTNTQQMVLYLGARQTTANVTVRINGTPWVKTYSIPANSVITSDIINKSGLFDARLLNEGYSDRGISITSDVPIVAYAHIYGSAASGATMLLPVGTYGYEYYSTNFRQNYAADCYSWFYVVADRDSTFIEITPSNPTRSGLPANVPFVVKLNKGEIYQVLGAINSGSNGFDLTGSKAKAIPNNQGKCLPFAMFSGSSRTAIYCAGQNTAGNGDNLIQQNFPAQAWGKRYLTAPTSNSTAANSLHTNIVRVVVKDPTSVVTRNGVVLTGLVNNRFYEFDSNTADYIVSDKPVMVAQYMASSGSNCANTGGNGDPEMIYISPIEQGIKNVALFRNTQQAITVNYVTLIIPTGGIPSLRIDGSAVFDFTYVHPNLPGYTVVVKRWTAAQAQTVILSDSAFTAITYGLGSVESYGYNAGTLVKNLNSISAISNTLGGGGNSPYTCVGTPFRFKVLLSVQPTQLTWQFSQVPNLTPNANVIQNNPVSTGTQIVNGNTYYEYTVNQDYQFTAPGTYVVPVNLVHPSIESCNSSLDITVSVTVLPEPATDFSVVYSGCVGDVAQFNGTATQNGTATTNSWAWSFGDATTATIQNPTKTYTNPGTYNVQLKVVGTDGCLGDTIKPVIVNPRPVVSLVSDSLSICINANATFTVQNPVAGATYNWYNAATGGTLLGNGTSYTISNVGSNTQVWVEGVVNGCNSIVRKRAIVTVLPLLTPPVASIDVVGVNFIQWKWLPVPNALTYDVSQNNGTTWTVPSSGATGLLHRITGLNPLTSVTLLVRANGGCLPSISLPVTGKTLTDQIYFPNSFTPNGDGLNDFWRVYGYVIKDLRVIIFNQWGENIFESRNQSTGWDGKYKGKIQPAGVYMYVVDMTLNDGTKQTNKGSINLLH